MIEELARHGVDTVFLTKGTPGSDSGADLRGIETALLH